LRQIYLCKKKKQKNPSTPSSRIKKKKKTSKRNTALEVKTSSFYWSQQSGDVSPIPSTCLAKGIFALGWPDWPVILGELH
jgi:hypothetical protein